MRAVVQEKSGKTSHAQVVFTNYESLTYSKTEVSYEKNGESIPIHAVIEDSVDDSPARMKAFRAFKKGLFDLHSGPISVLINNKLALAILSEKAAWLSPEERRTVEKHIPWTRHLAHGQTSDENGQEIDLPHFVRTQRKQCVLKKPCLTAA
ncbi:MAG: hypothetical protein HC848_03905 [Limnobacter sp.]|nr:hypothetical protein [Limnobacter sp.]